MKTGKSRKEKRAQTQEFLFQKHARTDDLEKDILKLIVTAAEKMSRDIRRKPGKTDETEIRIRIGGAHNLPIEYHVLMWMF